MTRRLLLLAILLTLTAAPVGSRAVPFVSSVAQCSGPMEPGDPTSTCTASVNIVDDRRVTVVGTHGNFHAPSAEGTITMKWVDPTGRIVQTYVCESAGMYYSAPNPTAMLPLSVGPHDLASTGCQQQGAGATTFKRGVQRLVVTADLRACDSGGRDSRCTFHGQLTWVPKALPA